MIMIVFTLALVAGSTQLSTIAAYMASPRGPAGFPRPCPGRSDDDGARRERPHPRRQSGDAPRTDHGARGDGAGDSARHLAMIELAASLKLLLYLSLIVCLFVPWSSPRRAQAGIERYRHRGLYRQARPSPASAGAVRDRSRQDARLPRAGISWALHLMLGLLATLLLFVSRSL